MRLVEIANTSLSLDQKLAPDSNDTYYCSFDLQKALPTPKMPTNDVYYLRQLWTYNLGFNCFNNKDAHMFCWPEYIASRGTDEIGSCILKYLGDIPDTYRNIVAWCDNCAGQNKAKHIIAVFLRLIGSGKFDKIDQKFPEPGHTYLPNDRNFGVIEKLGRSIPRINVPKD